MTDKETNDEVQKIQDREDTIKLMAALREIFMESSEADIVRVASEALTGTASGRAYLEMHPIIL